MDLLFALALEEKLCHKLLLNVWQHSTNHLITHSGRILACANRPLLESLIIITP